MQRKGIILAVLDITERKRAEQMATGAAKAVGLVLPELKGKLDGVACAFSVFVVEGEADVIEKPVQLRPLPAGGQRRGRKEYFRD